MPTYTEAAAFANRSDNYGTSLKAPAYGGPSVKNFESPGQTDFKYVAEHPRYPDYHYPDDKARDTYYAAKKQLAYHQPTGTVVASDKDIQYVIDKKNAQELALFKQFVEDSIPRGTPWAKEFFEKIMPGWYQSKIDIIQDKLSIVNRFIDITIRGPQTIDDMFLLYQLYVGKFKLPSTFEELIYPEVQNMAPQHFASGLVNPKWWVTTEYWISRRNQKYMSNFTIPGVDTKFWAGDQALLAAANNVSDLDDTDPAVQIFGASGPSFIGGKSGVRSAAAPGPEGNYYPGNYGISSYTPGNPATQGFLSRGAGFGL